MSELIGPTQVAIITSRAKIEQFGKLTEKDDLDTCFWSMPVSREELIYSISIHNSKHVLKLIEKSGVFAINLLPYATESIVRHANSLYGEHVDKFKVCGLVKQEARSIDCPIISEACGWIECQLIEKKQYKDYTVLIAKIINSEVKYHSKRLFSLDAEHYTTTKDQ